MLNSISLHRKEALFQNDNMTFPLLQSDVQTCLEVNDYGVARVCLKMCQFINYFCLYPIVNL